MSILGLGPVLFGSNDAITTYMKGKEPKGTKKVLKSAYIITTNMNHTTYTGQKLLASSKECPTCSTPGNP